MKCDTCKTEMEYDGTLFIGCHIKIDCEGHPINKRVEQEFGKLEFYVCHVCWLKSLGVNKAH